MASAIDSTAPPLGGTLRLRSTLLHRPAPAERALTRSCLCAQLDEGLGCALTLVSAPPGFGKSVLVNQWSHTLDRRCAWLSLDSSIDELRWFLAHLVAAIDLVCPDTMSLTSQMVGAAEFPDEQALVTELSNELDELEEPIAIVLEDYHLINSPSIHRLMSELLRHPPAAVHFVIITRQDPPLPLASLRSKGRVRDVRMDDLAFSNDETLQLVDLELGRRLPADQERALERSTEGWPIGVRMAIEAIRTSPSGTTVLGAGFLDRGTQEYLLAEVLEGLPADVRRYLLTASLFDQFTAKLCEVAMGDVASRPTMMSGAEFIDWVSSHNLFIIALDAEGVWFRFHHLFGHLLQHWRSTRGIDLDLPEAEAHRSAARYLESEGLIEEAIEQFALAHDHGALTRLAASYGDELIDEERWVDLERLLSVVPASLRDRDPAILVLRAWIAGEVQSRHREMLSLLHQAETYLDQGALSDQKLEGELRGQILELRGAYDKLFKADFDGAIEDAQTARALLADRPGRNLAFAYVLEAVALAAAGRTAEAHQLSNSVLGDERFADAPFNPLIFAMPFVGWLAGDLGEVERYGAQLLDIGNRFDLSDTIATAHYFLGTAAYERNRLAEADEHLAAALDLRYLGVSEVSLQAGMALALSERAQGRINDADATAGEMMKHVLEINSEHHQPVARGFLAELDLRCGRKRSALEWATTADIDAARHQWMFYEPMPTLVEALLTSSDATPRAVDLLDSAIEFATHRHHTPLTIRLLGLRAIHLAKSGEEAQALDALESAIVRSHRSGIVRRLADLGSALVPLVSRLQVDGEVLAHAATILAAIDSTSSRPEVDITRSNGIASVAGEATLTGRELDVLKLLNERLSNKEIAGELFIAPATVKKRTVTLYAKLNVHGRREAVAKARALGYLQD